MDILVVSPHPDDAEFGVGGLIHQWGEAHDIDIAVCAGQGDLQMLHSGKVVTIEDRKYEQVAASKVLNVRETIWLDLAGASRFDVRPQVDFVRCFDDLFPRYSLVLVPRLGRNEDHCIVHRAAQSAFRAGRCLKTSFGWYEHAFDMHTEQIGARYFRLTMKNLVAKQEAIRQHQSQIAGREGTIAGTSGVEQLARLRGMEIGGLYAEKVIMQRIV